MGFIDLIRLVFDNLGRRKGRVAMTAIGVVIGTAAIVILVSLAIGLQENATSQLYGVSDLSQMRVMPNYSFEGPIFVSGAGGGGGGGGGDGEQPPGVTIITPDSIAELESLPGVERVVTRDYLQVSAFLRYGRLETYAGLSGIGLSDLSLLNMEAVQGVTTLNRGEAIIGISVPNQFYDPNWRPGQEPPAPPDLVGQQLRLTLIKWDNEGNEIRKSYTLNIVGLLAETRGEADWSIYVPMEDITAFNEWGLGRRINRTKDGYNHVIVKAENTDEVTDLVETITGLGYLVDSPATIVQGINSFFLIMQIVFGGVGAVALLVAAIGIANTMAMAILERTREIGLMKAIGATNRDVLTIFLGEASGIGFIGGIGGVLTGWLAGNVINVVALAYLAGQAASQGGAPPPTAAVITPAWLPLFAVFFATLVGLLSGLYPALRAATLIPIQALKYE